MNTFLDRGTRKIHTSLTDNIKLLPAKKYQPSSRQDVYHKKHDNTPQLLTLPTSCRMTSSPFIWLYDWEQRSQIVSATIYQKTHNIIGTTFSLPALAVLVCVFGIVLHTVRPGQLILSS